MSWEEEPTLEHLLEQVRADLSEATAALRDDAERLWGPRPAPPPSEDEPPAD